MKNIIAGVKNAKRIDAEIKLAEGKATERRITSNEIFEALETLDKRLNITKKAMDGVKTSIDIRAQTFPNSYKYRASSTQFDAEHINGNWKITNIYRGFIRGAKQNNVKLTDEAKAAILANYMEF